MSWRDGFSQSKAHVAPLACFVLTGVVFWIGTCVGWRSRSAADEATYPDIFQQFDGGHFCHISSVGYKFVRGERSELAFFPAYPLLARAVRLLSGADATVALLAASNLLLPDYSWPMSVATLLYSGACLFVDVFGWK